MANPQLEGPEKEALLQRGSIAQLELLPEDLSPDLSAPQRLMMQRQVIFLRAFAKNGIVLQGCNAAGVARTTLGYWRENYPWFETLYLAAQEEAADRIEAEAIRRAVDGYDEPVIYQGMPTIITDAETGEERNLTVRKYSDTLMQMVLKGARPEKYRENQRIEHAFDGQSTGVLIVPAPVSQADWEKAAKEQQAKYAGNTGEEA